MSVYTYFILGILLGLGIAIYFVADREERIKKNILLNQKIYSSEKLDKTMENIVDRIKCKIDEVKRELTEDEKNEIIIQCYQEKFYNN